MKIKDIMTISPETLSLNSTMVECAKKMFEFDIGFLPICDKEKNKIVGTLTDRDIVISGLAKDKSANTLVKEFMQTEVVFCYENDEIEKATSLMQEKQIRRMLVLDEEKKLVGILSLGDLAVSCDSKDIKADTLEMISQN